MTQPSGRLAQTPSAETVAAALVASVGLVHRRLRQPLAEGELTFPERSALGRLERGGPTTATALAKAEQISPQSMGATISALEARELIVRAADPADGRRVILSLNDAGRAAIHAKRAARYALVTEALERNFTSEELEQLMVAAPLLERLGHVA
jgi:DNA-binding MarR family transcriptional regulator